MATTGAASEETTAEVKSPPNPIATSPAELAWTAGSFFVLLIVMRYFLFPKLKKATDARYDAIRADIEGADEVKSSARTAVAEYEAARAAIQSEAAARIDAARQTLDNERTAQLAQVKRTSRFSSRSLRGRNRSSESCSTRTNCVRCSNRCYSCCRVGYRTKARCFHC